MHFLGFQTKCFRFLKSQQNIYRNFNGLAQQKTKNSYSFKNGTKLLTSSTLGDILDHAADIDGDSTAFISSHQGISKTFQEFRNEAEKLASGLIACGLQQGDRLAIFSPNCYEWPLTQFAAAKAGLILVNINSSSQPLEVEYALKKVGCKGIVAYDRVRNQDYYDILNKVLPGLPSSNPNNIQSKNLPNLKTVIMISDDNKKGIIRFKDVMNSSNKDSDAILSEVQKLIQFEDPVNIQYTSGTTGEPKGALLSHHNIINNASFVFPRIGYETKKPVICCQVPLFHCFGCVVAVLGAVLYQGTCVFPSAAFDPTASLQSIEKHKCTISFGTPTMYVDLIRTHRTLQMDISSLNEALIGGAPCPDSLTKALYEDLQIPQVLIGYGLTENSPCLAVMRKGSSYESIIQGYLEPIDYVELKVVNNEGHVVPLNTPGELCSRGHIMFLGYWDDKEKTSKAIDQTNWFHTGDLAVMNEKGWVKIIGRIKDMVIRGGENIYVAEVENFINSHPAVQEVSIVGVPDERLGEELCCWINVKSGMTLTEEEIKKHCKGNISSFKIPRYIMFVEDFPKTTSGKIKKTEMAEISKKKLNLL